MIQSSAVDEYQAILKVLGKYNEGCAKADSSLLKSSFDSNATLFHVDQGKLTGGSIQILFDALDKDLPESPDANAVVVRIDLVGTAASARVDTEGLAGMSFTDFFHLLKVDMEWIIVSKIFHMHA